MARLSHAHPQPTRTQAASSPELDAYNAAFDELGLDWHWDGVVWATLQQIDGERERVCAYLRGWHPHLLTAYDADFLGAAIVDMKSRRAAAAGNATRATDPHDARR